VLTLARGKKAQRIARERVAYWKGQPSSNDRKRWLATWESTLWQLIRLYGVISC